MSNALEVSPEQFVEDFFTSFTEAALSASSEDAGAVVDRYYTPDIVLLSDGIALDRAKLIAHLRPIRKNLESFRFEVHEALRSEQRIAARYTIHAELRSGQAIDTEVYMFGVLDTDGRIRRTTQLSRS